MEFLQDSSFWYLVSFVVFAIGAWKFGKPAFLNLLDTRIEIIKKEIETAESLRVEAQELLAQYQRKYRDAVKDAETILDQARVNAQGIKEKAIADLQAQLKRAEEQHKDRLELMKQEAIQQIKEHAALLAVEGTRKMISEQLDAKGKKKLIQQSIENIDQSLN